MSNIKVTINGREYTVPSEVTILEACNIAGVYVPSLCNHPRLEPTGACRVCVIEVEGARNLQPACATKVQEGMKINTNTERVEKALRFNLSLLLSRHPKDCMTCEANGRCEFQDLIYRYDIKDMFGEEEMEHLYDDSSPSVVRDLDKCIICGRCVRACSELQGMDIYSMSNRGYKSLPMTAFNTPLYETECISCGQCALFCPTGAITENPDVREVLNLLERHDKVVVVQTAPATRVAIGEEFGMEPGSVSTGKMVAALKRLGFDYVFDTNFAADLTIVEEGSEFLERLKNGGPFPMFTSCCPAWINLMEKNYPELINNVSSAKSPQQMLGPVVKTFFAKKKGIPVDDIVVVSIMPCTAKKDEAKRPLVLTTRELAKLIRMKKIPFASLPEENYDDPLGESTGAAALFGTTGGVMEAALRTAYELATGKVLPKLDFTDVRGLSGIKEAEVDVDGKKIRVAVAHGTAKVRELVDKIVSGEVYYDFVDYSIDERSVIRKSHENPSIKKLYEEFLERPLGHLSHELLHTTYSDRSRKVRQVERVGS